MNSFGNRYCCLLAAVSLFILRVESFKSDIADYCESVNFVSYEAWLIWECVNLTWQARGPDLELVYLARRVSGNLFDVMKSIRTKWHKPKNALDYHCLEKTGTPVENHGPIVGPGSSLQSFPAAVTSRSGKSWHPYALGLRICKWKFCSPFGAVSTRASVRDALLSMFCVGWVYAKLSRRC